MERFDPLSLDEQGQIVDLAVVHLAKRLEGRRVGLAVTDAAREWLAFTGFDPAYGARPLCRRVMVELWRA